MAERRYRAIAFAGGMFDTYMQLGVAHALLVLGGKHPECIAGTAAGAVNAVAVAEVLQCGEGLPAPERRVLQFDRLRAIFEKYADLPEIFRNALLPDSLEVMANRPLKPIETPLHNRQEREHRKDANESRAGVVSLLNDLFRTKLSISDVTVIVHRILSWIEAGEKPRARHRIGQRLRNEFALIRFLWRRLTRVAPVLYSLVWTAWRSERSRDRRRKAAMKTTAGDIVHRFYGLRAFIRQLAQGVIVSATAILLAGLTLLWIPLGPILASVQLLWGQKKSIAWLADFVDTLLDRVLAYYGLRDSLGSGNVMREFLINLFDPDYYGDIHGDEAVRAALAYETKPRDTPLKSKKLRSYKEHLKQPILVAPMAANVATGTIDILGGDVSVVDALMAASAWVPIFPPVKIQHQGILTDAPDGWPGHDWYIDAVAVSNQPISPLLRVLPEELTASNWTNVDIYQVTPFPISSSSLRDDRKFDGILSTTERAVELQEFRDARMERTMTRVLSRVIPSSRHPVVKVPDKAGGPDRVFVRADITPIELDAPPRINRKVLTALDRNERRSILHETVAKGCRASLEAMIPAAMAYAATEVIAKPATNQPKTPICMIALRHRSKAAKPLDGNTSYPGLPAVCRTCSLMPAVGESQKTFAQKAESLLQTLEMRHAKARPVAPDWPTNDETAETFDPATIHDLLTRRGVATFEPDGERKLLAKHDPNDFPTPVIALLFGGGVFRGVFHMGVANALSMLDVKPHIVAGSSVGSIVGAMIGEALSNTNASQRANQIRRLAGTFLALDKFVMTDRMADFIRRFTIHAGRTDVSPRDIDQIFRRFESDKPERFDKRLRRVAAGIEKLLYITPFELFRLTRCHRDQNYRGFETGLRDAVQNFFDRSEIGRELLGAEPLQMLLEWHVLRSLSPGTSPEQIGFKQFQKRALSGGYRDLNLMATVTNLSEGRLEVVGARDDASVLFTLLASSAFPAVFRPRQEWEIFRDRYLEQEFLDGGIMDNLPLDSVTDNLDALLTGPARHPDTPHLLFTATLEIDRTRAQPWEWKVESTRRSWRRLWKRSKTLAYNRKVDAYARLQRNVRKLYESSAPKPSPPPLNIEVVAVKPRWLCGTFGFHPMLGFKRWKQAASIAHGCASTLAKFYGVARQHKDWIDNWNIALDDIDEKSIIFGPAPDADSDEAVIMEPQRRGKRKKGICWFQKETVCPFSIQAFDAAHPNANKDNLMAERKQLSMIYDACGRAANHEASS